MRRRTQAEVVHRGIAGSFFFSTVFLETRGQLKEQAVESLRFDRNSPLLKLAGIDSLAKADALAGTDIYVPEEALGPPEKGYFYDFQVIGSTLLTEDGKIVGRVTGVLPVGDRNLLVADRDGKEILIPFMEPMILGVDPAKKEIRVDLPDGLLELNEI